MSKKRKGPERIKWAAIKWCRKGEIVPEELEHIVTGRNHGECITKFSVMGMPAAARDMDYEQQGFITSARRFVGREEAFEIALRAGQLGEDGVTRSTGTRSDGRPHQLFSEDIVVW